MTRNEAQTRFELIDPALETRGWKRTDIRIETTAAQIDIVDGKPRRRPAGRSDYLLRRPLVEGSEPIPLGSIAMLDEGDAPGITSPDYVVMRGVEGRLHPVWFYHWFRSRYGAEFILSLTRGAVREHLLFNRLAKASLTIPTWATQLRVVEQLRQTKAFTKAATARLETITLLPAALLRDAFADRG